MKLPGEPWYRTAVLFSDSVQSISANGADWVESTYEQRERLRAMLSFISQYLSEGVSGHVTTLERVWFFPWTECEAEMELAFAYALAGLHRASLDHSRRALELVVVGAYFVAEHIDSKAGASWLESRDETPPFSRALKSLGQRGFAKEVTIHTDWPTAVLHHYWALSDSVHVRGQKFSIRALQSSSGRISGFPIIGFSPERLATTLDTFICTGEHILVALVIANPILLFGAPMSEKYGLDGPIGFFEDGVAEELRELLPSNVRDSLVTLAAADEGVNAMRQHFDMLPDITPQEINAQMDDL